MSAHVVWHFAQIMYAPYNINKYCYSILHKLCVHPTVHVYVYIYIWNPSSTHACSIPFLHKSCVHICILPFCTNDVCARHWSLQHTATHCNTLQPTATHCNPLHHTAPHCNTLQHTISATTLNLFHSRNFFVVSTVCCSVFAVCCSVLQCVAVCSLLRGEYPHPNTYTYI